MRGARRKTGRGSRWTAAIRRVFGASMVLALALSTLLGGHIYYYCRAMGDVMCPSCPCAAAPTPPPGDHGTSIGTDCFEVRRLGRLAAFHLEGETVVPGRPLVAILPTAELPEPPSGTLVGSATSPIRAGPRSPLAAQAKLMVFLT